MWFRAHSLVSKLLLIPSALTIAAVAGCSSDKDPACGGVVGADGVCYAKCEQSDCASPGQRCVAPDGVPEGACFSPCETNATCGVGFQCGEHADTEGQSGRFCLPRSSFKDANQQPLKPGRVGDACAAPAECDQGHGVHCENGACTDAPADEGAQCTIDAACDASKGLKCVDGSCQVVPSQVGEECGGNRTCGEGLGCLDGHCHRGCERVGEGCADGFECVSIEGQSVRGVCTKQKTAHEQGQFGTSCPNGNDECDAGNGWFCVGLKGTASAYCSQKNGCEQDSECPSGYWCGAVTNVSDAKVIDYDHPIKTCMKRDFCAPCQTDLDCSFQLGAVCRPDVNGENFCTLPCEADKNSCMIGTACVAGQDGANYCRPDVGFCHASEPTGCGPCRIDSDCGPGGLCREGSFGYKPTMKWCSTPCGGPDADGKNTCPVANNGNEMVCLDENLLTLGGPITEDAGNSVYKHCYAPYTVDNTDVGRGADPAIGECGNAKREGDEECDDANKSSTDGCSKDCKVTDACRFTVAEPNGDDNMVLMQNGAEVSKIPASCRTFLVEGSIEEAGDIDVIPFVLPDGNNTWIDVFTDTINTCNADLMAEVRGGDVDLSVPCEKLSDEIMNLAESKLCSDGKLGCGSCTTPGLCGVCDDDSGIGNCPRLLASTLTSYGQYTVKFDSTEKKLRIYARNKTKTVGKYLVVGSRLETGLGGSPLYAPGLSCWLLSATLVAPCRRTLRSSRRAPAAL